ncbi:MAG TPA: hypothetical protein VEI57_15545 [Nitrospirota bacterium]|nr:hypothetical protein [Nitrospirota bacterium]
MVCPRCGNNTIPFSKVWIKGGLGTYRCPSCNAICRIKESVPLTMISTSIGFFAGILGLYFRSWILFGVVLAIGLLLDVVLDSRLRRLELAVTNNKDARRTSMSIIEKLQNVIINNAIKCQIFFSLYGVLSLFNGFFGIYALYKKGYPAIVWFYRTMIGFFFVQAIICFFAILALSIIRKSKITIK